MFSQHPDGPHVCWGAFRSCSWLSTDARRRGRHQHVALTLDGGPVVAPIRSAPPGAAAHAMACTSRRARAPSCQRNTDTMAPWQRLTIYRSTLAPAYAATAHLFEALPLHTYPAGTTMEPLAYAMAPGAYLGRVAPGPRRGPVPRRQPPGLAGARASGVSFREACARGYLRPYAPQRVPDAGQAALVEEMRRKTRTSRARRHGTAPRRMPPEPRSAWGVLPTPATPHVPWR